MSAVQRWLLPAGALRPLAVARDLPLPAPWALPATPLDEALLGRIEALPTAEDLQPWRAPVLTCALVVAALGRPQPRPTSVAAGALEAHLTVGADRLVTLTRRDGVGLVELSAGPAEALADELDRVLQVLGGAAQGEQLRAPRAAFTSAGPTAHLLARATRVLETTLVRADGALTGALWYDAGGWWRVRVDGSDVVLTPQAPRARDWAPLLDQVLA